MSAFIKKMKALVCSFLFSGNFAGCVWGREEKRVAPALNAAILEELAPCTRPKLETSASLITNPVGELGGFRAVSPSLHLYL